MSIIIISNLDVTKDLRDENNNNKKKKRTKEKQDIESIENQFVLLSREIIVYTTNIVNVFGKKNLYSDVIVSRSTENLLQLRFFFCFISRPVTSSPPPPRTPLSSYSKSTTKKKKIKRSVILENLYVYLQIYVCIYNTM